MERTFKNIEQAGMSLLEICIVMMIVSTVSVSMMSMFIHMFQNQAKLSNKNSLMELEQEIKRIISSTQNCGIDILNTSGTIAVSNWNNTTEYNIPKLKSLQAEFSNGITYDKLNLNTIKLSGHLDRTDMSVKYVGAETGDPTTDQNIYASLRIEAEAIVSSNIKTSSLIHIPIMLALNSGGTAIESCMPQVLSEELTIMCSSLGGEWETDSGKCTLPCPDGFIKSEDESKCEYLAEDDTIEDQKVCNNLDSCETMARFSGSNYK